MTFTMPHQPELRIGSGRVSEILEIVISGGYKGLAIVTGGRSIRGKEVWSAITEDLLREGVDFLDFTVRGEPSPDLIDTFRDEVLRDVPACEAVVAIGGGSVIDAGKALAALLGMEKGQSGAGGDKTAPVGGVASYLEGVGTRVPTGETLPLIAVPTTAGTGSEATKNAVISTIGNDGFKKSLRHDNYIPRIAIIDPDLHRGCPDEVTRASGLDAITQLIEVYMSTEANPLTDALALEGLRLAGDAFPRLLAGEDTAEHRSAMAVSAYLSGVGLAAVGLGIVHGIASPLGAALPIPHGVVCGATLAPSIRYSLEDAGAARKSIVSRYGQAAEAFGLADVDEERRVTQLLKLLTEWAEPLPGFSSYGLSQAIVQTLVPQIGQKNHPVSLSRKRIEEIMNDAM